MTYTYTLHLIGTHDGKPVYVNPNDVVALFASQGSLGGEDPHGTTILLRNHGDLVVDEEVVIVASGMP